MRLLVLCFTFFATAETVHAQSKSKDKEVELGGRFKLYDPERRLLQASVYGNTVTLVVEADAKFLIDGEPTKMKLEELPEGSHMRLTLNAEKTNVLGIDAVGPYSGWKIESIDHAKRRITVNSVYGKKHETYEVVMNAKITKGRTDELKFDEVKPNDLVYLYFTFDRTRVLAIVVREPKE
jgi:hypothetical protein